MKRDWDGLAGIYGKSARSVKRWAAMGAPVDKPEEMAGWWAGNMSQRCPKNLLKVSKVEMELPVYEPAPQVPVGEWEVGLAATLGRMQELEVFIHREYQEAIRQKDDGRAKVAQKNLMDLASKVALLEEKNTAHLVKIRDLIPRLEAEMALSDFHQDFHGLLRGCGDRFFRAFGIEVTAENEVRWQEMMDGVCSKLQLEVFGEKHEG